MTTQQKTTQTELAEIKRELHARIRARAAAMTSGDRARYVASLSPSARKLHEQIIAGSAAREHTAERTAQLAAMDRAMGLCSNAGTIERSRHQLSFSVLGSSTGSSSTGSAARSGGTLLRRPAVAQVRPSVQPPAAFTAGSPAAADMDQRMGTAAPAAPSVRRTDRSLEFLVGRN